MKVLMTGAAGHVGSILRPAFEARHECRYLDVRPVDGAADRSLVGSLLDGELLARAMDGVEACVHLAMAPTRDASPHERIGLSYDVHVKGMHHVLDAAVTHGVKRVVYASTLSVYRQARPKDGRIMDESWPPDAIDVYGLTKRLGEVICEAFATRHPELSVFALQMVAPRNAQQYAQARANPAGDPNYLTGPEDLQRVYLAAVEHPDHHGYDAVFVCSDVERHYFDLSKAERLLGWVPEGR